MKKIYHTEYSNIFSLLALEFGMSVKQFHGIGRGKELFCPELSGVKQQT